MSNTREIKPVPQSGKISDVYNPKYAFVLGSAALGVISLGTGFVNDKIVMIVLRALGGIGKFPIIMRNHHANISI
jgi:MFS family permease